ncbi:glycosyltransferase family 2 protein [Aurantibacter sp.]|uniref:glycosyltransferase family 2 protein n=1 Tax=Aurantibacter sp. TaxID=2807103 RepID=UPI0035C7E49D
MPHFTLIICTYMRAKPLCELLDSVNLQSLYPNDIIIVDGSVDRETEKVLQLNKFNNLRYLKVGNANRGLTKQRNYGINNLLEETEIVCFLDDDTILDPNYFEALIGTYSKFPNALGVGGYITNEVNWEKSDGISTNLNFYYNDGYKRTEPSRFKTRRKLGLEPDAKPGYCSSFSHGRSVSFLPPTNKTYKVEQFMGGVSSFKKSILDKHKFSTYFEGYGLYEDADYTFRISKLGDLYVNTAAKLGHYHNASGRPNKFSYGKMVIRNGWYVWRVRFPSPTIKARIKWNATALLLTFIRATNIVTTSQKKEALTETIGRCIGWLSLLFNKPKFI